MIAAGDGPGSCPLAAGTLTARRRSATIVLCPSAEGLPMLSTQACQVGGRFSRCHISAVHTCQYCGKPFCDQHTYFSAGHEAVCARKRCRAKHDDLQAHLEYKKVVGQRNHVGLCGIEACGPHPGYQCSLCQGHFCALHLSDRMYPFREGWVAIERPVSVCQRCWERRKIWRGR